MELVIWVFMLCNAGNDVSYHCDSHECSNLAQFREFWSFAESLHFYAVPAPAQTFMRIPLPLYYKIAKFLK
jgi:hypothetical protein